MKLFAGSSHPKLAREVAVKLGIKLGDIDTSCFPNQECRVWIKEPVKNEQVYILQTLSYPVNDNLIELCLIIDAAKRAGAKKATAVIPWLAYSPQDKVFRKGEPLSSKLIARFLETAGADEVIAFDLHNPKNKEHFQVPVRELSAMPLFIDHFKDKDLSNFVSVALDDGAAERAEKFSNALDVPLCLFDKTRDKATGEVEFKELKCDVKIKGKTIISFDDFVSTGGTRIGAAEILKKRGVKKYIDCITHIFPIRETYKRLQKSKIDELFVTDTIPIIEEAAFKRLKVLSVAGILADSVNGGDNVKAL